MSSVRNYQIQEGVDGSLKVHLFLIIYDVGRCDFLYIYYIHIWKHPLKIPRTQIVF